VRLIPFSDNPGGAGQAQDGSPAVESVPRLHHQGRHLPAEKELDDRLKAAVKAAQEKAKGSKKRGHDAKDSSNKKSKTRTK
jgi:hypothetical protein